MQDRKVGSIKNNLNTKTIDHKLKRRIIYKGNLSKSKIKIFQIAFRKITNEAKITGKNNIIVTAIVGN